MFVDVENVSWLGSDAFDIHEGLTAPPRGCESVAERPWPDTLRLGDPSLPLSDFFDFDPAFLVMTERARSVCSSALDARGEFIPFKLADTGENIFLFNTRLYLDIDAVAWTDTRHSFGVHYNLTLKPGSLTGPGILRIPKLVGLFIATRLEPDTADFFHLYQQYKLTGLYFKKLWDEATGPVLNRSTGRRLDD